MTGSLPFPDRAPRIGLGQDSHRLLAGRPCRLAGIDLDSPVGPIGHSDADAILHAVTDALLGAAGLEDLGSRHRDDDPQWKGQDSRLFVSQAMADLRARGLRPISLDLVAICDHPRLAPHRDRMRASLSDLLQLPIDRVNLKGKTTEGRNDDRIEVTAVVLVVNAPAAPQVQD